jgi:hypothetical protein
LSETETETGFTIKIRFCTDFDGTRVLKDLEGFTPEELYAILGCAGCEHNHNYEEDRYECSLEHQTSIVTHRDFSEEED